MLPLRHQTAGMVVGDVVVIVAMCPCGMGVGRLIALAMCPLGSHLRPPLPLRPSSLVPARDAAKSVPSVRPRRASSELPTPAPPGARDRHPPAPMLAAVMVDSSGSFQLV